MRLVYIIMLTGSLSMLFAQGQKQNAPSDQPAAKKQSAAPVEKIMEGMLVSVDQTKQTFIVRLRGTEYPFTVNNTTEITTSAGKKTFADLSAGEAVRVTYTKDNKGNRVAASIHQRLSGSVKPAVSQAPKPIAAEAKPAAEAIPPAQKAPEAVKPAPATAKPAQPAPK